MNARVEERVDDWGTRPFSGGHAGLRELADEEFSGVVDTDRGTWLCLLNGKVVGVFDGRMADVESAEGTAYVAPDPALPLLFAMWEQGGTQEDRYYTKDTPISEADATLSSGGFAGYIELSDNVLSGDYYVCYYGDRSMSVAFVGANGRLVTGDEAFDRADDEIGIYDVYSVDLDVVEVPKPDPESGPTGDAGHAGGVVGADARDRDARSGSSEPSDESPDPVPDRGAPGADSRSDPGSADPPADSRAASGPADASPDAVAPEDDEAPATGTGPPRRTDPDPDHPDPVAGSDPSTGRAGERSPPAEDPAEEPAGASTDPDPVDRTSPEPGEEDGAPVEPEADPGEAGSQSEGADPLAGGAPATDDPLAGGPVPDAGDRATPERPDDPDGDDADAPDAEAAGGRSPGPNGAGDPSREGGSAGAGPGTVPESTPQESAAESRSPSDDTDARERPRQGADAADEDRLRQRVRRQAATIDRLQDRISTLEADREDRRVRSDRLADRIEEVAGDLAELRRTVMRLDRTVERLEADADAGGTGGEAARDEAGAPARDPTPSPEPQSQSTPTVEGSADGRELSVEEALRETTVLVRYGSQGKSTLKTAHGGGADAAAVDDNLRLTAHTAFDDATATVEGRPYAEFLRERIEYRFFEWLLRELLYEIRDTGNQDALRDLYDAIPRIDRAEFSGTVEVGEGEDAESVAFDLVARDDRDRPLVAMNFQESRDPATEGMVVELQDRAKAVCEATDLAAAFLVTTSYFDGAAKDAAEAATSGRILSRSSKESFVRLSRKRGFHLCLAAVSDGDFHLRTPEL